MRVRLTAGKAAPYSGSGLPARQADYDGYDEAAETHPGMFYPNREKPTPLRCGCEIPWPIVTLLGTQAAGKRGDVHCDIHGWQPVSQQEKARANQLARKARKCGSPGTQNQLLLTETDPTCPF